MPTRNVVLTEHQFQFIASLVSTGRYQNASEVMREGIRLVERQEVEIGARLEAIRDAVRTGIEDIAERRFSEFDGREALRNHLVRLARHALAEQPSEVDDG